ncbi:MAG: hypothetical protein PHV74_02340 [Dehalococcoidia bacterium]|nr:hypothetical protein [Dehalococcoidia bacterium]
MNLRWILTALLLMMILPIAGCGDDSEGRDISLASAIKAMEENPRFSIFRSEVGSGEEVSFDRPADEPQIEFVLPDRFSYYEEDAYDIYSYNIAIGNDIYVSEDGVYWEEVWGTGGDFNYALSNPYKYLKHALSPVEVGSETIDGKPCRVFEAELDVEGWAKDNLPSTTMWVFIDCPPGDGESDMALVESLGYEFLDRPDGPILSENTYIELNSTQGCYFQAQVRNATELTTELKAEFIQIAEAFGMRGCDFDNAEVSVHGGEEYISGITKDISSMGLRIYVDEESALPRLIETEQRLESSLGVEKYPGAIGINYDENIRIEKPEKVLYERKAEGLYSSIQNTGGELQQLLRVFKDAHGVFPERLDAESMSDTLKALSREWPGNALTGEPVVQKENSPGDYSYRPTENGSLYELIIYDYWADPIHVGIRAEELEATEETPPIRTIEAIIAGREIPDALNALVPSKVLPPLTEAEKNRAVEIAITDMEVLSLLEDTDHAVWDVYPHYSETAQKAAQVIVTYFLHPYKIDFGALSVTVDLESAKVMQVTPMPENLSRLIKEKLYEKERRPFPELPWEDPEKQSEAKGMALADPTIQAIVEGSEYVITDIFISSNGQASLQIRFFAPKQFAGISQPLNDVSVNVNLDESSVALAPMALPPSALPTTGEDTTGNYSLSQEQQEFAIQVALVDPRVQDLLQNREYEIWNVIPYYYSPGPGESSVFMGAGPEIRLKEECIIEYDWPFVRYNDDGTIAEKTYHSATRVKSLHIFVHFAEKRVIEISPMPF